MGKLRRAPASLVRLLLMPHRGETLTDWTIGLVGAVLAIGVMMVLVTGSDMGAVLLDDTWDGISTVVGEVGDVVVARPVYALMVVLGAIFIPGILARRG